MKLQYPRFLLLLGLGGLSTGKSVCKRISDGEIVDDASIQDINDCYACNGWHQVSEGNAYTSSSLHPETEVMYKQGYQWCGANADDKFEMIFRRSIKFAGFTVRSSAPDAWTKELEVWYGDNSDTLLRAKNSTFGEVFQGNVNDRNTKENTFGLPFTATFISVIPKSYESEPCLTIDFYSCQKQSNAAPQPPMGMSMGSDFSMEELDADEMSEDVDCPPFECDIHCLVYLKDDEGCSRCACDITNQALLEGDIRIDSASREAAEIEYGIRKDPDGIVRGGMTDDNNRWVNYPSGDNYIIPYVLDGSLSDSAKQAITPALQEIEYATCLQFRVRTNQQYYMKFFQGSGCWSYVGNIKRASGGQQISIGSGCDSKATIQHEVLHALGFWHEQSRADRDDYVNILTQNIQAGKEHNFDKRTTRHFDSPYDYKSVMHYSNTAFSSNGQDTIQAKSDPSMRLGQNYGFSFEDIRQVHRMYKCTGSPVTTARPCINKVSDSDCARWKDLGYCGHSYVAYMEKNCGKTCGTCTGTATTTAPPCTNIYPDGHCTYWEGEGYCDHSYVPFMTKNCAKTCDKC